MYLAPIILLSALLLTSVVSVAAPGPQPHQLQPVPLPQVTLEDNFWSPKIKVWREVTINDCFNKFEKDGAFDNFDQVRDKKTGTHRAAPWYDGLAYEMITASADFLAAHPNPALEKRLDGYIERITAAAAVDPNGYVNTYTTLQEPNHRWGINGGKDTWQHDLYNAGCLVEAGVHYYRATGKTGLLQVATRMANYMCQVMGPAPRQNIVPGHAIAEQAFVQLYLLYHQQPALQQKLAVPVHEQQYLELAEFWIDNRGNHAGRQDYGAYDQDDKPVTQQATLEGHAVRAALLATGVAQAARVSGQRAYYATAQRWWENLVERRMYLTGGLGAVASYEGFGADYDLPNSGYSETCAAVAGGFFHESMNLAYGDARYADELERVLYNGALSGVSLDGVSYFYQNPLVAGPERQRWAWSECPCCPPMFLKMMGALPGYIYATDEDGAYINLYIGSEATIAMDKWHCRLKQTTQYPWNGDVKLEVAAPSAAPFSLNLRLPGWCEGASLKLNGHAVAIHSPVRGYACITRAWRAGDVLELRLPMPVQRIKANPNVRDDVGRVALMRGPVVYCLEGVDNAHPLRSLVLSPEAPTALTTEYLPQQLGGVTIIHGQAQLLQETQDAPLYSATTAATLPVAFTAIPYYANANRQPTTMQVWMADNPIQATPLTLAASAVPSASHCNAGDTVLALNDGIEPKDSADETLPRFIWWDHKGSAEWAQYTFNSSQQVTGVEVYWWDETRLHRDCRVPQSWTVQYQDHGQWKPVTGATPYGTQADSFNRVTFDPIHTTALRIAVQLQPGWSGGILEWRVLR